MSICTTNATTLGFLFPPSRDGVKQLSTFSDYTITFIPSIASLLLFATYIIFDPPQVPVRPVLYKVRRWTTVALTSFLFLATGTIAYHNLDTVRACDTMVFKTQLIFDVARFAVLGLGVLLFALYVISVCCRPQMVRFVTFVTLLLTISSGVMDVLLRNRCDVCALHFILFQMYLATTTTGLLLSWRNNSRLPQLKARHTLQVKTPNQRRVKLSETLGSGTDLTRITRYSP